MDRKEPRLTRLASLSCVRLPDDTLEVHAKSVTSKAITYHLGGPLKSQVSCSGQHEGYFRRIWGHRLGNVFWADLLRETP